MDEKLCLGIKSTLLLLLAYVTWLEQGSNKELDYKNASHYWVDAYHHMRKFKADLMQIQDNGTCRSHMQNLTRTGCFRVQRGVGNMNIYYNIAFTLSLVFFLFLPHPLIIYKHLHPPFIETTSSLLHLHDAFHRQLLLCALLPIHSRRRPLHTLDPCNT